MVAGRVRQSPRQKLIALELEDARRNKADTIIGLAQRIMLADSKITPQDAFDKARTFTACAIACESNTTLVASESLRITERR